MIRSVKKDMKGVTKLLKGHEKDKEIKRTWKGQGN